MQKYVFSLLFAKIAGKIIAYQFQFDKLKKKLFFNTQQATEKRKTEKNCMEQKVPYLKHIK